MRLGSRLAALFLIMVIAISTCSRTPTAAPNPSAESADPEVGGGAGADTGPQTPVPTATVTREGSPRLEGAETAVAMTATAAPATPQNTATVAPSATAPPSLEPATAVPATPELFTATPQATPPPPTTTPTPGGERVHVVQAGENLYRIGLLYGLSWVAIAEYNGITDPNTITVGQELRIPPSPTATPAAETNAMPPASDTPPTTPDEAPPEPTTVDAASPPDDGQEDAPPIHAVAAGDTLYGISRQYGVNWAQVAEANGLATPNQLYPGQLLKIPPDVPGPTPEFNHRVHNGETLSGLARQYGLSAEELAAANGLAAPYTIYSGQTLVIPSDE